MTFAPPLTGVERRVRRRRRAVARAVHRAIDHELAPGAVDDDVELAGLRPALRVDRRPDRDGPTARVHAHGVGEPELVPRSDEVALDVVLDDPDGGRADEDE